MRLWHKDLLDVLPRQQLLGQWRECCLIAKNIKEKGTPNHILVNRIMNYPIEHFYLYASEVADEMEKREYKCDFSKFTKYITLERCHVTHDEMFKDWHNDRYLNQCVSNLQEKYDCGGISYKEYDQVLDQYTYILYKWPRRPLECILRGFGISG